MNKIWENILKKNLSEKKEKKNLRNFYELTYNSGKIIEYENKKLINFASNNYLGLANDKRIIEAGKEAAEAWGAGSGSSRLVSGTFSPYKELEKRFALWSKKEASLIFNSGYNSNIGVISCLADKNTVVFCDKLNHASIYDGIFLSGAILERYPHNNLNYLEKSIKKYPDNKKIIITDAVFSMDGDAASLSELSKLARKYGCLFIVDEAHSAGIFADDGSGLVSENGINEDVDIIIGTCGKSFGVFGSYAAADQIVIDYLINNARSFIFTTSLPPFVIGALNESLNIIIKEKRGGKLLEISAEFKDMLKEIEIDFGESVSQIIPIIVGSNEKAIGLMNLLKDNGYFVPVIRPPTVPVNTSRIRISLSYFHDKEDLTGLYKIIKKWKNNIK